MYDYGLSTLEKYGLTDVTTARTRGALLCHSGKDIFLLKEYHGSEQKLALREKLQEQLLAAGCLADVCVPNQEGALVTRDRDEIPYTLSRWYESRECDPKSRDDILRGTALLATLHKNMHLPFQAEYQEKSLVEEYVRHNRELKKIRKFIRGKGPGGAFEKDFLANVGWFLEKGEKAVAELSASSYEALREKAFSEGQLCHGEYTQHNILFGGAGAAAVNFDHFCFGVQMSDLYDFMRKMLEKHSWDLRLAREMLNTYHQIRSISREEWENLRIRFTYPEKYWKLANYYYSHNKAWISEKNVEKQQKLIAQKELWGNFPEKCFGDYPW